MIKVLKRLYIKIIILALIFFLVIGAYFLFSKDDAKETKVKMDQGKLPLVYMTFENQRINLLHGYTGEMEESYMRDSLTPIPDDYEMLIEIDEYESSIKNINYEIKSLDSSRLVEKGQLSDWDAKDNILSVKFKIDEVVSKDTEYILIINLTTDDFDSIKYYTRILSEDNSYLEEKINFVYDFNEITFDKSRSEELIPYLEPAFSLNDNSNFGYTNIHSNYRHVSWGKLEPERASKPIITIKEQFGNLGSFELKYLATTMNENIKEYYNVTEYYRVNIANNRAYLLNFERSMDQVFIPSQESISKSRINLGISNDLNVNFKSNPEGNYIAFSHEGNLWCMNTGSNEITKVFSFLGDDYSDIRHALNLHEIQLVNVDDDGNIDFILYGYMNRGEHEGEVGLGLYKYSSESKEVEEIIFLPSLRPYEILEKTLGNIMYVSDSKQLHIMVDDSVYSIDITGNEFVELVSGLRENNYVISNDGDRLAWHVGGSINNNKEIRVLNLQNGVSQIIHASEGEYIKALGFLGDGFAYGIANTDDFRTINGVTDLYMNEVRVINSDNETELTEKADGIYYLGATSGYNNINLDRVQRSADTFVDYPDFMIYDLSKKNDQATSTSITNSDIKKKQIGISFANKLISSDKIKSISTESFLFKASNDFTIKDMMSEKENYYIYAGGNVIEVTDKIARAINIANNNSGLVVDDRQRYIWVRGIMRRSASLSNVNISSYTGEYAHMATAIDALLKYNGVLNVDVQRQLISGNSPLDIINSNFNNNALDLTGATLEDVLYFISSGQPVMSIINNTDALLIVGYDSNSVDMVNLDTGERYKQAIDEAQSLISGHGNRFISLVK